MGLRIPVPFTGCWVSVCLGRCVYTCATSNYHELYKKARFARVRAARGHTQMYCRTPGALPYHPHPLDPLSLPIPAVGVHLLYCMYVCIARKLFTAFSVGSNQMCCNNYYVHSFGFLSPRTKVYLFFGNKYSGFAIVKFITKTPICTDCRVHFSWELLRP